MIRVVERFYGNTCSKFPDFAQAWDHFQNKHMFDARDANNEDSSLHHLAEMIYITWPAAERFSPTQ
jgi:hypothetical protein